MIPVLTWTEGGHKRTARWISESRDKPPARVVVADDAMKAETAFRLACEGCALIWRGDFQNARQMLEALARRADRKKDKKKKAPENPAEAFHRHRMARSRRAQILGMVLVEIQPDGSIPLKRAPDVRQAVSEAIGPPAELPPDSSDDPLVDPLVDPSLDPSLEPSGSPPIDSRGESALISLREVLGMIGAHEWRRKGIGIPFLETRIYPHYGVFPPTRSEYVALAAKAPLPQAFQETSPSEPLRQRIGDESPDAVPLAMDIGTGTGVLAALLAEHGVRRILATDNDPRAVACARKNMRMAGMDDRVRVVRADLFPAPAEVPAEVPVEVFGEIPDFPEKASLIVFNPPWIPAKPVTRRERSVYDPKSAALHRFLFVLPNRLAPDGEAWLLISDLAERLGLRPVGELTGAFEKAGLKVIDKTDAPPAHNRSQDPDDPLHFARSAEVVSLWRLGLP